MAKTNYKNKRKEAESVKEHQRADPFKEKTEWINQRQVEEVIRRKTSDSCNNETEFTKPKETKPRLSTEDELVP